MGKVEKYPTIKLELSPDEVARIERVREWERRSAGAVHPIGPFPEGYTIEKTAVFPELIALVGEAIRVASGISPLWGQQCVDDAAAAAIEAVRKYDVPKNTSLNALRSRKDAEEKMAALVIALRELEAANETLCALRNTAIYSAMMAVPGTDTALWRLDDARRRARELVREHS